MGSVAKIFFNSGVCHLAGNLILPDSDEDSPAVLFLHGGGGANKERFRDWQEFLAVGGLASLAFDFTGIGESQGEFKQGTLGQRLKDGEAALGFLRKQSRIDASRIGLVGASMGAHVAGRLVGKEPSIKALLLSGAAAYSFEAEDKSLGPDFTSVIRKEDSWVDSPVFKALGAYKGGLMVVYGESDQVIPKSIQEKYLSLAKVKGRALILEGVGHKLLTPSGGESIEARRKLYEESLIFFKDYLW